MHEGNKTNLYFKEKSKTSVSSSLLQQENTQIHNVMVQYKIPNLILSKQPELPTHESTKQQSIPYLTGRSSPCYCWASSRWDPQFKSPNSLCNPKRVHTNSCSSHVCANELVNHTGKSNTKNLPTPSYEHADLQKIWPSCEASSKLTPLLYNSHITAPKSESGLHRYLQCLFLLLL